MNKNNKSKKTNRGGGNKRVRKLTQRKYKAKGGNYRKYKAKGGANLEILLSSNGWSDSIAKYFQNLTRIQFVSPIDEYNFKFEGQDVISSIGLYQFIIYLSKLIKFMTPDQVNNSKINLEFPDGTVPAPLEHN
jgi:hypothetical protein